MISELYPGAGNNSGALVTTDQIADRAGVRVATIVGWMLRFPDFPAPHGEVSDESVWLWTDVDEWLSTSGRGTVA